MSRILVPSLKRVVGRTWYAVPVALVLAVGVAYGATDSTVTICHLPPGNPSNVQLITVGSAAVPAHVANHGDAVCAPGDSDCCVGTSTVCTNLQDDAGNCGSCGNVCTAGSTCEHGECVGEVACTTDLDVPCGAFVGCGNDCNCWVKADRSEGFCGVFDSCDNHIACDVGDSCPQGLTCIENCCGKLCYPACGH